MRNYDICIIGGGASGLAAAASLSSHFHTVLLEKNGILGRKIMATGGGRCNITNTACAHCDLTLDFFKSLGMERLITIQKGGIIHIPIRLEMWHGCWKKLLWKKAQKWCWTAV